jgi:PAS domain S-box-containing protein
MTVQQAAQRLSVHPNTIHNYVRRGLIIGLRHPRGLRVLRSSVEFVLAGGDYRYMDPHEQMIQSLHVATQLANEFRRAVVVASSGCVNGHICPTAHRTIVNEVYKEMLGWGDEKIYSLTCDQMYHPDFTEEIHRLPQIIDPHRAASMELKMKRSDGKYIWVRASGAITILGGKRHCVATLERI